MTPDVNVLVAAARRDHVHHAVARSWLEATVATAASGRSLMLMPMVLASFLRLVTSPRIFKAPTPIEDAIGFVDALLATAGVHLATVGPEWPLLRTLCIDRRLASNALADAWLVAATMQVGEHLVSFDRGLRPMIGRSHFTLLEPAA